MNQLAKLTSEEFFASIGTPSSPKALRRYLHLCTEVKEVRTSLASGQISEETIRRFVDELKAHFVRGVQFPYELTLAALAVALETWRTDFADNYLLDLARLRGYSEMHIAPRIAGLCLSGRQKAPKFIKMAFNQKNRLQQYWRAISNQRPLTTDSSVTRFNV
ncbi:MAG: hypothetical protein WD894_12890 [Pirellulales bacterium]